jgi:hypothetical protein
MYEVNGVAKDDNYRVKQDYVGEVGLHSRKDVVHNYAKQGQSHVVVNTDVGIVDG